MPPAVEGWNPNHWTAREFLSNDNLNLGRVNGNREKEIMHRVGSTGLPYYYYLDIGVRRRWGRVTENS